MRPRTNNPKFANFRKFCTKIIAEILAQPEMQGLPLERHLNMLASYLDAATAAETLSGGKVATAEKLLAFDLANFALHEKWIPKDSDLDAYPQLKTYMPFVCAAAKGESEFIRGFAWTQNLEISEENLSTYETCFKESTAKLIEKATRYAIQCNDIRDHSYYNYFSQIESLQSPTGESPTEELSVIEAIKSKSHLYQIIHPATAKKKSGDKKRTHSDSSSDDPRDGEPETKKHASTPINVSGKKTPVSDLLDTLSDFSVSPSPKKASPSPQKAVEKDLSSYNDFSISLADEEIRPATASVATSSAFQAVAAGKDKSKTVSFGGRN